MNYWNQRTAFLRLSEAGREVFATSPTDSVMEVEVEWADELGLWVFVEQVNSNVRNVQLIKWSHFETATFDVLVEQPRPESTMGFKPYIVPDKKP